MCCIHIPLIIKKGGALKNNFKRKDIWERIEKGEITGFSIEAKTAGFNYDNQNSIFLRITPKYWHDVKNILDESNVISGVF